MTIEEGLRAYVLAIPQVTAVIGQRYSPIKANEGVGFPRIVYHQAERNPEHTLAGKAGMCEAIITLELQCKSFQYDTCNVLAKLLDVKLDGKGQIYFGSVWVMRSMVLGDTEVTEEFIPGQDEKCTIFTLEVSIYHQEVF